MAKKTKENQPVKKIQSNHETLSLKETFEHILKVVKRHKEGQVAGVR